MQNEKLKEIGVLEKDIENRIAFMVALLSSPTEPRLKYAFAICRHTEELVNLKQELMKTYNINYR